MKKFFVLACFLIAVVACAPQPSVNNTTSNTNATSEAKPPAMPSEADIIAKEKTTWDLVKKKDWAAFEKMLASDFVEVLNDGVHDRAQVLANLKDFDLSDVTYADWKFLPIDTDAALLTYSATLKGTYKGEAVPAGPYRLASGWVKRNGEWVTIYYQETMAKTAPPPPPPPAKSASKAATSPMAKPAEAGPDVAANEKLVWDALKSGNYDAFASYLASDSIEVEPDGVYDKTGTVKSVSMVNFSKVELGDWKTVKFNDDASLVAYTVKLPKMEPDYHATLWVKRGGKWQALFHQGTPGAKHESHKPAASPKATTK
jgi:hypothetical protein